MLTTNRCHFDPLVAERKKVWHYGDDEFCCYCGKEIKHPLILTSEHIVPKSKNGSDLWINRKPCCNICNNWRGNKCFEDWLYEIENNVIPKRIPFTSYDISIIIENIKYWKHYSDSAGERLERNTPRPKKPRKAPVKTDKSWLPRWYAAHYKWHEQEYPMAHRDGHYSKPTVPKVSTANGLTNAICHYLKWIDGIGNRINVGGRKIEHKDKTIDGRTIVSSKGYMTSSTLKGTADILASLPNGKTWHIEIKVKNDKPRPEQIAMQLRILKAKGHYDFIHNMTEFFSKLDLLMPSELF